MRSRCFPLGSSLTGEGVNFCVYSRNATRLELLLFESVESEKPRVVKLERTYHYWHGVVPDVGAGQLYGFRADGPAELGFRPEALLYDPYARQLAVPAGYERRGRPTLASSIKSQVVDRRARFDWDGDAPLGRPFANSVIYEMHLAGFTRHPSSGVRPERRGTCAGLVEKIPYLQSLGITAVELLPVFHFDPQDAPAGHLNYWGYSPLSFFALHPAYSHGPDPIREFKTMVKALHRAGIEVILDVVYNHTAEGGADGPTVCWKGLDRATYYLSDPNRPGGLADYTGCGNTLNGNHTVVRRMILDSLRYWVQDMHVDGFRFDLASILARDEQGRPQDNPPVLWDIETDPVLAGTKLIAEAWDASGLYQVGSFIGDSWKEWNGRFRDDVRGFLRAENGSVRPLADRLLGSPDVFGPENREAEQSINFVTCHDGFTLNDLVSYDAKHNEANGEDNRDGSNDNRSWNCGQEGPTADAAIEALRERQIRNFLTLNLLALGTPMLTMGDEVRRSQLGNNNAYCQDNELSWLDWSLVERNAGLLRFVRGLIAYRTARKPVSDRQLSLTELLRSFPITWHGIRLNQPDWSHTSHTLAFTTRLPGDEDWLHVMLNAYWEPLRFELPEGAWSRWLDTARPAPEDLVEAPGVRVTTPEVLLQARSVVVLRRVAPG